MRYFTRAIETTSPATALRCLSKTCHAQRDATLFIVNIRAHFSLVRCVPPRAMVESAWRLSALNIRCAPPNRRRPRAATTNRAYNETLKPAECVAVHAEANAAACATMPHETCCLPLMRYAMKRRLSPPRARKIFCLDGDATAAQRRKHFASCFRAHIARRGNARLCAHFVRASATYAFT